MNQQNLDYLKDNLRYMGFGDKLYADLEKNIQQGFPEFVLKMQSEFSGQKLDSILFFRRADGSDLYFFNKHDAVLKNEVGTFEHGFYVNKGHGVTLKEAFNLLEGRSVYKEMSTKEGGKYHAWIEFDFKQKENGNYKLKQFHDNYGYDLKATLAKYPIKELQNDQQRERLVQSLEKGNRQSVTMLVDGKEQMFFLQANPQYKSLTVYDKGAKKPLTAEQKNELMVNGPESRGKINGEQPSVGEGSKQGAGRDMGDPQRDLEKSKESKEENSIDSPKEGAKDEKLRQQHSGKAAEKESKKLLSQREANGTTKGLNA